ncbi:MAG TPA: hypothetical protein VFH73_01950 [Polyangia bacterium]|nr:hypothetical protein [Polyangia bacterium]
MTAAASTATGWSNCVAAALLATLVGGAGCATATVPAGATPGGPHLRNAPDDSELGRVVPLGSETVVELDMIQLRSNPWSRTLVNGMAPEERQARAAAQGFDDIADVDHVALAVTEVPGAEPAVLTVSQGRFSQDRVARAFAGGGPAPPTPWRGSPLWQRGDRAIAFVTPRTLIAGPMTIVRAAIDCAYGVVPDVWTGELGTLRRALNIDRGRPALVAVATVSDGMRQRVGGDFEVPPGLRRVAVRLDLGGPLDAAVLGTFDDPQQALAAARMLDQRLGDLRRRPVLRILGLASLLDQASISPQGSRVTGQLHLSEDKREDLGQRVGVILEALLKARAR